MKPFWRGFLSVFDFSRIGFYPKSSRRLQNMLKDSKNRAYQEWYQKGSWWDHAIYRNFHEDFDEQQDKKDDQSSSSQS